MREVCVYKTFKLHASFIFEENYPQMNTDEHG